MSWALTSTPPPRRSSFEGVRRRFTHVGDIDGITVVDDYGHHPTEIKATLAAASSLGYKHVDVVFQPHRYSRLQACATTLPMHLPMPINCC